MKSLRKLLLVSAIALVSGCGSDRLPTYPVKGEVVFEDGRPVRAGNIEFYNSEHDLTARGVIKESGEFQMGTFYQLTVFEVR